MKVSHRKGWLRTAPWLALLTIAAASTAVGEPLVEAAARNETANVLAALEAGADAAARASDGTTALHWAAYYDDSRLVQRLIDGGADVNAVNDYGSTPLSEAALAGSTEIVRSLLAAGAEVDRPGADGQTALMIVARTGNIEAARLLIEHGADVNAREAWRDQTAVIWAAAQGQPEMIRLLIEHGADPNARSAVNDWDRQVSAERRRMYRPFGGMTALMYAAREGCAECAQALVEGGADPNLPGPRNEPPLVVALNNFSFDVAAYLIDAGADPNRWDWWGRSPLYAAVDMNTIPHGGRPDRRSVDATTSLELIEKLLDAGANPNLQLKLMPPYRHRGDDRGCDGLLTTGTTPLLRAAKTFDTDAMSLLIAHGAIVDLPQDDGVTPLMAAAGYGSLECDIRGYGPGIPHYQTEDVEEKSIAAIDLLLAAGARIDAVTTGGGRGKGPGQTALFGAAFWGWNDVLSHLVAHGAKVDAVDAEGRTAIDAALGRSGGHDRGSTILEFPDTARLLRELCADQEGCELPTAPQS